MEAEEKFESDLASRAIRVLEVFCFSLIGIGLLGLIATLCRSFL